jgi:hypothetical protein
MIMDRDGQIRAQEVAAEVRAQKVAAEVRG